MRTRQGLSAAGRVAHVVALYVLAAAAGGMTVLTALSAGGVLPWLDLAAGFGSAAHPLAGMVAQAGLTALLLVLLAFFPSNWRILALERSHRDFRVSMNDVANAYHQAHMADRAGAFTLSSEFDQVRERLVYLREHPELKLLEADVLTLAAQMSQQSHRLASIYSDDKVARARDFLQQRQKEAEDQSRRIEEALKVCREVNRWASQVELEEATVASRLGQLDDELRAVLPALGYDLDAVDAKRAGPEAPADERPDNVVQHPATLPAAE